MSGDRTDPAGAPPELPAILLVPELARMLGLSQEGVRSLIRRGQLPAAKLGKRFVVRRERFLELLERLEAERAAETAGRRIAEGAVGATAALSDDALRILSGRGRRPQRGGR